MNTKSALLFLIACCIFAGCAGTKKVAQHPLVGAWTYSIDTPEGVYSGLISITESEGVLQGILNSDALPGEIALTGLAFAEDNLTFSFDSGQFGVLDVDVDVLGDAFDGFLTVPGIGEMPMKGERKVEEEDM